MRKKAGLVPTDTVLMQYEILAQSKGSDFEKVVENRQGIFENALRGRLIQASADSPSTILEEEHVLGGLVLKLQLVKVS